MDPVKRLATMQTAHHVKLELYEVFECGDEKTARLIEKMAHSYLNHTHLRGEWFECGALAAARWVASIWRRNDGKGWPDGKPEYRDIIYDEQEAYEHKREQMEAELDRQMEAELQKRFNARENEDEGYDKGDWFEEPEAE